MEEHIVYKYLKDPIKITITDRDIEDWIESCNNIELLEYLIKTAKNHIKFLKNPEEYYRNEDYMK